MFDCVSVLFGLVSAPAPNGAFFAARATPPETLMERRNFLGRAGISAGVATFPQDGVTGEDLLSSADRALYDAKRAGRNRVTAATPVVGT